MIVQSSSSFTRPADTTAYSIGDLVANSTTAVNVVPLSFVFPSPNLKIWRAGVTFNSATPTNGKFILYLYRSSPTVTNGDNGAWLSTESGFLGSIAIDASTLTFSDKTTGYGYYILSSTSSPLAFSNPPNTIVYGLLAAAAAYTPTNAEVFTVTLTGEI